MACSQSKPTAATETAPTAPDHHLRRQPKNALSALGRSEQPGFKPMPVECTITARRNEMATTRKDSSDQLPAVAPDKPCAYEESGCRQQARVRVQTKTGWANMCVSHYQAYHGALAREYCKERGLLRNRDESDQAWHDRLRHWMRARPQGAGRMHGPFLAAFEAAGGHVPSTREPGSDDE